MNSESANGNLSIESPHKEGVTWGCDLSPPHFPKCFHTIFIFFGGLGSNRTNYQHNSTDILVSSRGQHIRVIGNLRSRGRVCVNTGQTHI